MANPFDNVSLWIIFLIFVVSLITVGELGYWLGRYKYKNAKDKSILPVSRGRGALMTLLAFLLAFTFGIASNHFHHRKQLINEEANAIGTAYLRAELLPEPQRQKCKTLLRDYVRDRSITRVNVSEVLELNKKSGQLHEQLWSQVASLKSDYDYSIAHNSFAEAIDDVIGLHLMRLSATLRTRIPIAVWLTLYTIAILTMLVTGYVDGLSGKQQSVFVVLITILTFSLVLILIHDLDRPISDSQLIKSSKQSMVEILQTMKSP